MARRVQCSVPIDNMFSSSRKLTRSEWALNVYAAASLIDEYICHPKYYT
jgi:hypothetical protein